MWDTNLFRAFEKKVFPKSFPVPYPPAVSFTILQLSVGYKSRIKNFIFANGFSGHGYQQSPAIGRGIAELIIYKQYKTINLSQLDFSRVESNKPFTENAII